MLLVIRRANGAPGARAVDAAATADGFGDRRAGVGSTGRGMSALRRPLPDRSATKLCRKLPRYCFVQMARLGYMTHVLEQ
jgi:hypothetical protein